MTIADEKYVSLTTFKKDGTTTSTPVWIADFGDGTIGFTTSSSSYKVKRLRNDARVELQPSNAKGDVKAGTEKVSGTAIVVDGAEFEKCRSIVKEKYGIQYSAMTLFAKAAKLFGKGPGADCAIRITPDS